MRWGGAVLWTLLLALAIPGAVPGRAALASETMKLGEFIPAKPPQPAPAASFTDPTGNPVSLEDFRGRLILVNLWATWCQPCLREMPSLERLQANLGGRLAILAVSEDRGGSKVVQPFLEKLGLSQVKVYLDPKSNVGEAFAVRGLPTSVLIDANGRVVGRVEGGADWDSPKILAALEPFLGFSSDHAFRGTRATIPAP